MISAETGLACSVPHVRHIEYCPSCFEPVDPTKAFVRLFCGHELCGACFVFYLQEKIELQQSSFSTCPANPQCLAQVHPNDIRFVLKNPEFDWIFASTRLSRKQLLHHWEYLQVSEALRHEKDLKWCPRAGCHTAVLCGPQIEMCPNIQCMKCAMAFCALCSTPAHPGQPCRDFGDITELYPDLVKRCPACRLPNGKQEGCHYGECGDPDCKTRFCWCCGEKVTNYRHFKPNRRGLDCTLSHQDLYTVFWPIRWFASIPKVIWCILTPCWCIPASIAVPPWACFKFPIWWTKRCWRRMKKRPCASLCCRIVAAVIIFGVYMVLGCIVGLYSFFFVLFFCFVWCIITAPCSPVADAVEAISIALDCCFAGLGLSPDFIAVIKVAKEEQAQVAENGEKEES